MRLQEIFLIETTEEDRAIVSLAQTLSKNLRKYKDVSSDTGIKTDEPITIGKLGDMFDLALQILGPVTIKLQSNKGIKRNWESYGNHVESGTTIYGIWFNNDNSIVMNMDKIGTTSFITSLTHELRHALDDFKSGYEANKQGGRYSVPRKKEHRDDIALNSLAEPAELNARFLEVLHTLIVQIKQAVKIMPIDQVRSYVLSQLSDTLDYYHISEFYPEKHHSKHYKRLIKRSADLIDKEVNYYKSKRK